MKTREQVEALKINWKEDACWDIEETEGFEEYKDELREFRDEQEQEWREQRFNKLLYKSESLGIRGNIKLTKYLEQLESRINNIEERLDNTEGAYNEN